MQQVNLKKQFRIITCTNEKELYINFWPTMAQNWKWYGIDKITCGFITERTYDDPLVKEMQQYGEIILFNPLPEVEDSVQAKATRLYLATQYENDYCVTADIDQYILNKEETWDKWFSNVVDDKLLCVCANYEGPYMGSDIGKFPMGFTTAKGTTWKEVINPNNLNYKDLFKSWFDLRIHDHKEAINQPFSQFSDESLLRALISKWDNYNNRFCYDHPKCLKIERDDWKHMAQRRIDRGDWNLDKQKLNEGYYYDSQPLRPFNQNIDSLEPLLNYLKIKKENWHLSHLPDL